MAGWSRQRLGMPAVCDDLTTDQIINLSPRTICSEMLATEAVFMMAKNRMTNLLVVDGTRLIGAVHLYDLFKAGLI